jgi:hypothetical protein
MNYTLDTASRRAALARAAYRRNDYGVAANHAFHAQRMAAAVAKELQYEQAFGKPYPEFTAAQELMCEMTALLDTVRA